ncbi:hypothetical protein F4819DRAFT_96879 [Hypoxylon fuscum]|nr:hypothetical protein F4819DRAFT_96879 [Hypoxylon fuscum]
MASQSEVEILIHIDAPSRATDDSWYRALATSYLEFQPEGRVDVLGRVHPSVSSGDDKYDPEGRGIQQEPIQVLSSDSSWSEDFGNLKSPQASFRSVIDNAGSPYVPARRTPEAEKTTEETTMLMTQSSWQTPSSVVQDSYVENHVSRANISSLTSPTRVLEHYLQQLDSPSASSRTTPQWAGKGTPHNSPSHNIARHNPKNSIPLVPDTPFVVPGTPQCDFPKLGRLFQRGPINQQHKNIQGEPHIPQSRDEVSSDNIIEETVILSSSDPSSVMRADSEPPPTKRHRSDANDISPRAMLRTTSDIGPRSVADKKSALAVSFLSRHGYTNDSLEIRAPDPPISVEDQDSRSFITPGLQILARDLDLPKRYRPKKETRALHPIERGYWLLDCTTWDLQLQRDAWAYLANYVGTGTAGWGIWCMRDLGYRWLRVYCWGSVAAHIYLLLYLASQRRILYTGCSWIDSDGTPTIIMEAKR